MLGWLGKTIVVVLFTAAGVAAGAIVGLVTCGDDAPDGVSGGFDSAELDCLEYHVLPGAAIGLVVGIVLGLGLALRHLEE
jgi:hypothetical protein